jgi:hypothetical protein
MNATELEQAVIAFRQLDDRDEFYELVKNNGEWPALGAVFHKKFVDFLMRYSRRGVVAVVPRLATDGD